jgi:hypothetical protein
MKLPIIRDELQSNKNNYVFHTEHINSSFISKISILDNNIELVIKELKREIEDIDYIKEEMVNFHNRILSSFFKALRNGDREPENSIDIESLVPDKSDTILSNHINNRLDDDIIAILIAKDDNFESVVSDKSNIAVDSLELSIKSAYKMIKDSKNSITRSVGEIDITLLIYVEYQILYLYRDELDIFVAISAHNKLAHSIKMAKTLQKDILSSPISNRVT